MDLAKVKKAALFWLLILPITLLFAKSLNWAIECKIFDCSGLFGSRLNFQKSMLYSLSSFQLFGFGYFITLVWGSFSLIIMKALKLKVVNLSTYAFFGLLFYIFWFFIEMKHQHIDKFYTELGTFIVWLLTCLFLPKLVKNQLTQFIIISILIAASYLFISIEYRYSYPLTVSIYGFIVSSSAWLYFHGPISKLANKLCGIQLSQ